MEIMASCEGDQRLSHRGSVVLCGHNLPAHGTLTSPEILTVTAQANIPKHRPKEMSTCMYNFFYLTF